MLKVYKKFTLLLALFLLLSSFLAIPQKSHALGNPDQYCTVGVAGSQTVVFTGNHSALQIFVPTKNTLDAVSLWLKTEVGNTSQVKVSIGDFTTERLVVEKTQTVTNQGGWVTYDFPDTPLPPSVYFIYVQSMNMPNQASWKMAPRSCYSRGEALVGLYPNADMVFGFAVYAYDSGNQNPPNNPPTQNPPASNPPSGSSGNTSSGNQNGTTSPRSPLGSLRGSGQAPTTQTAPTILPPKSLGAKDKELDYGGYIDLNWTASSTTNIDGYKVFRRAEGDWEYVEILRLPKNFTSFTDPWATKDKTYYYKLRSYKRSQESADSNVASATSKDDMTGLKKDILDDYKKNAKGGVLGGNPLLIIVPILIVLIIIGLFILGLWVLFHRKKQPLNTATPTNKDKEPPK